MTNKGLALISGVAILVLVTIVVCLGALSVKLADYSEGITHTPTGRVL